MELLGKLETAVLNPVIIILFGVAVVIFVYGVVQFIWKSDDEEARQVGAQHIMWGLIGLFIMTAAIAIKSFIKSTIQ
ncbi:MAG: hypothetical protein PHS53_00955 [Candidatus Pacebacteria bacterium]|nr:hypothetical protein [Candidatus Paceibacterota bacterium]MDD5356706.1 hypothetical protein [Candidatus Paceibacterota bacterium]